MSFVFLIVNFVFPTASELPLFYYWHYEGVIDGWLLYDQVHWSIGFSAVAANASFRDAHVYLGLFGYLNSCAKKSLIDQPVISRQVGTRAGRNTRSPTSTLIISK
ncbi:unnamed protein product [Rotaria magnacalcarata]|uniref:Uncharacterized protein n=1 Tax=Rotaria magnacalcarata TaxID=392030 RepID=A0A819V4M7_9BILA|nr:unnamed protein product [Rotaria magnacalcarata]CAF4097254.1 unnamed protein product [Rotaria magnacalcarata]